MHAFSSFLPYERGLPQASHYTGPMAKVKFDIPRKLAYNREKLVRARVTVILATEPPVATILSSDQIPGNRGLARRPPALDKSEIRWYKGTIKSAASVSIS